MQFLHKKRNNKKARNIKTKFHIFNTIKKDFILSRLQKLNILTHLLHICVNIEFWNTGTERLIISSFSVKYFKMSAVLSYRLFILNTVQNVKFGALSYVR